LREGRIAKLITIQSINIEFVSKPIEHADFVLCYKINISWDSAVGIVTGHELDGSLFKSW
jgi:hypothetical protein